MRIENLRSERKANRARVVATVAWEDCDRPGRDIYFETEEAFAEELVCNPNAFLVASVLPAMRNGEQRIVIDGNICPELRNGLMTAMGWLQHWYGEPRRSVRIESNPGIQQPIPIPQRAGSFLSGGVDSLAVLRKNRLDFPRDHPRSIRDCIIVHGFDIGGLAESDSEAETFKLAVSALSEIVDDAQVTLIPIATNIRHLDDDIPFWIHECDGAALSAVAHSMSRRLTSVSIASSFNIANSRPRGVHPLLVPNYGSTALRILHEGILLSRLEKVRLVADWDAALRNLRVCTWNPPGMLNCGVCEKCIRTMLQLVAVGKLADSPAFPENDVSREALESMRVTKGLQVSWLADLLDPLREQGRLDLVQVIENKQKEYYKHLAWEEERDWKGAVKRFDRRFLGSGLFRSYKFLRQSAKKIQTSGPRP